MKPECSSSLNNGENISETEKEVGLDGLSLNLRTWTLGLKTKHGVAKRGDDRSWEKRGSFGMCCVELRF